MNYKILLAAIATIIGLLGYIPYIYDTIKGKTRPHVFSWLIWTFLSGIAFLAQVSRGAGTGAWATGVTSLACLVITLISLKYGEKDIKLFDKLSLVGAGIAVLIWIITTSPLFTIIIITTIDFCGFLPSFRKAFRKPFEETLSQYVFASIKWVLSLVALESITLTTALFPSALSLFNFIFVIMLVFRRTANS